jgi:peptidoglycan/LPS O-acetylase OafA/YrhL
MAYQRYEGLDVLRVISSFGVVFLHVYVSAGALNSLESFSKFRDFALPLMVMTSFFVLTISLMRKPETDFESYFIKRLHRLWIPFVIWTFIYSLIVAFLFPIMFGAERFGELPSPIIFLTGYRHLWYLQFIFIGSLLCFPLIYWLKRGKYSSRVKLSLFCFCATFLYGILFYTFLKNYTDWDNFNPDVDLNVRLFVSQTSNYILYVPVAIGFGLMSGHISNLFARPVFRFISLVLVLITMTVHVGTSNIPLTREIYGIAVFAAALQPWKKIPFSLWQKLASYSYGVYILHFLPAQLLWEFVMHRNLELSGAAILCIALIIYFLSLITAVLLRKILPFDWFIPLVGVGSAKQTAS